MQGLGNAPLHPDQTVLANKLHQDDRDILIQQFNQKYSVLQNNYNILMQREEMSRINMLKTQTMLKKQLRQEAKSYEKNIKYYHKQKSKHEQAFKYMNAASRPRALSKY